MARYYAYRLQLSQTSQLDAFAEPLTKRQLIELVISESAVRNQGIGFYSKNKKHLVYYNTVLDTDIHCLQLAREDEVLEPKVGLNGVTDQPDTIYPYTFFIIDVARQIVLIQEKPSSFREIETACSRVKDFFELVLGSRIITAQLESISNADDVWEEIDEARQIYSLAMTIDPPNFFGSRFRSNIDIKETHEETNFTKFKLILENKLGDLRVAREEFQELIQLLSSGAGNFVIKLRDRAGNLIKLGNTTRPEIIELPETPSEIAPGLLRDELSRLDDLNRSESAPPSE